MASVKETRAQERVRLLTEWSRFIARAATQAAFTKQPLDGQQLDFHRVAGPRAGVLHIGAGVHAGPIKNALARDDAALLRQFVPWDFPGDPTCTMRGRYVRLEAAWPKDLAETHITLRDLAEHPQITGGRWVVGMSETGRTILPILDDRTPHFLVSGATGSGKSVALRSAVMQLSTDPENTIVLLDGKFGDGLRVCEHLPGVAGPLVTEESDIRAVLAWVCLQMRRRFEQGYFQGRIIVVFDEFQELTSDDVIAHLLRKLVSQGRGARVYCIIATQHPSIDAFGSSITRRNLTGKLALRVDDVDASRVAVGGKEPRADWLLGAGDAYIIGVDSFHRVQVAYVDEGDITTYEQPGMWVIDQWPLYEELAPQIQRDLPENGNGKGSFTGAELAVAMLCASRQEGRPTLVRRLAQEDLGQPGSVRAARLLALGRDMVEWMRERALDEDPEDDQVSWAYTGQELGIALVSTVHGEGRGRLQSRLEEARLPRPGSDRADRLLGLARDALDQVAAQGYRITETLVQDGEPVELSTACLPVACPVSVHSPG